MTAQVELFYAPQSRASGVRVLLEELDAPYKLNVLNVKLGENRRPDFLRINPAGKVPTLVCGESVITEQVAIYIYLADLFPEKGLAPPLDDPLRGPYLRWFVHMASCFEPALVDRAMKREEAPQSVSPYGSFDTVMEAMRNQLSGQDYVLGNTMTAVDVLWGMGLRWGMMFGLVPEFEEFKAYTDRFFARPAVQNVLHDDQRLASEQDDAVKRAVE
ncbi:glutathione S-transferase family protein [Roseibium denhamense]|uniref:Glutathione S-transferase n=1 Tax=Roseibium denhamense TaxID=76305 RepID=A0ABY1NUE9_9HYPH|nr:glutathione S-transferase family protein [Roseibium denhamense]MTI05380.1 glutathione S-transferase family protein [Roseibium denhamense]SMP17503.1 glutathione S-transferase [Roseibium denhamense]